jgi:DNA-binding CsgD family transcriptional regulator
MSRADRRSRLETDPLPCPPGLAVAEAVQEEDCVVLSFPVAPAPTVLEALSGAQREVAEGVLAGLPTREIARRRGVSPRTVSNQIAGIFEKLRVSSRLDLALLVHGVVLAANGARA